MASDITGIELQKIIARNIRHFRKDLGITQAQLALKVGISTGYVSDIEGSKAWPGAEVLSKIADNLKLAPFQLLLPTEDSPYFDRHRVLNSFNRQLAEAFEESRTKVYNRMVGAYGKSLLYHSYKVETDNS